MRTTVALLAASAIITPIVSTPAHAAAPVPASAASNATGPGGKTAGAAPKTVDISKVKVPTLAWKACTDKELKGLQCASALLPLDYSKPDGDKIEIHVAKKNATGKKKGVVFTNPGGPGELASTKLNDFATILGKKAGEQYDVIGVDPRGIHAASQARCWSDKAAPKGDDIRFPYTPQLTAQKQAYNVFYRDACAKTSRPIMDHISTAQVARDMEMIRKALGEKSLNYYGVSYGTFLGATYAALFPQNVGRMITDGVVDPVAWSTGYGNDAATKPITARDSAGEASLETLQAIFTECKKAGPKACANGATIQKEWDDILEALKKGPIVQGKETITFDSFISDVAVTMYDKPTIRELPGSIRKTWEGLQKKPSASGTPTAPAGTATTPRVDPKTAKPSTPAIDSSTAKPIHEVAEQAKQRVMSKMPKGMVSADKPAVPVKPAPGKPAWSDNPELLAVMCVDTKNPKDPKAWEKYNTPEQIKKNPFMSYWAWGSSVCAGWPGQDKNIYHGPYNVKPANPLLVIGNTHDPSTPLSNAKALAKLSPGARLLTVDTFGHVAGNKSRCAANAIEAYLVDGKLPAEGTVCKVDKPLFSADK
ncbi:hypothetical protein KEM60_00108 [Austwickia sp. TVS 96-490-7B]|uniref:alpha/beta hydrolase n=1 Tax=Austwickia sp. TVS 96-490-7B TaxID=2830843 RepID=UPI001C5652F8|nr:alpha/beta hydrolase [Austwickia sp. TVS 96-490-7B]MBW3083926.1 hypothetical protein [Austwickia sp. TVS 96-490-7B]